MPMKLALAYAREGFYVRPIGWTGEDLAWLHYPAGAPLAYYWDGTGDRPGRPWLADDLDRAEWLGYWTALPPACLDGTADTDPCLCDPPSGWDWAIYDDETAQTAYDDVQNPNAILGLQNCDGECACADTARGGSSSSSSTSDRSSPGASGASGSGGSGGGSGSGNPGGGVSLSGSGSSGKARLRAPKRPGLGPTITLTATLTSPADECVATQADRDHVWTIGLELSSGGGVTDDLYSVHITVLGEIIGQWILAPGDSASAEYTRSLNPLSASFLAIGAGAAFGGGPACITGKATLSPLPLCGPNQAPVAVDNSYSADYDDASATLGNVIGNDSDPDSDPLSVTPQTGVSGSNGGLFTLSGNGSLSFDPNGEFDDLEDGETVVTSINYTLLDDRGGNDTAAINVTVQGPTNTPPVAVDDSYSADANASSAVLGNVIDNDSDPDGDAISVTPQAGATGTTGGLFTILANGSFSFDPNNAFDDLDDGETRTTAVIYTLVDEHGATDTASVSVLVTGENDPLAAVGTIPDQSDNEGESISFATAAYFSDPDDTISYAATGLPGGLSINSSTGLITGTIDNGAETSSPYSVTITASAAGETDVDQTFSWTVTDPAPTAVGTIPDQTSEEGETISLYINSYFSDDDTLSYSESGLPSGLSLNSSTGEITGTLPNESAGNYPVTITATDGDADVDQVFDWTITDPVPEAVGTIPDQSDTEGDYVSLDVSSYFFDDDTLYYSDGGTLPPGLSISAGSITGTISAGAASGSPYFVTITASDGDNDVDQSFGWNVDPP
jgi:hypothetical protein